MLVQFKWNYGGQIFYQNEWKKVIKKPYGMNEMAPLRYHEVDFLIIIKAFNYSEFEDFLRNFLKRESIITEFSVYEISEEELAQLLLIIH